MQKGFLYLWSKRIKLGKHILRELPYSEPKSRKDIPDNFIVQSIREILMVLKSVGRSITPRAPHTIVFSVLTQPWPESIS